MPKTRPPAPTSPPPPDSEKNTAKKPAKSSVASPVSSQCSPHDKTKASPSLKKKPSTSSKRKRPRSIPLPPIAYNPLRGPADSHLDTGPPDLFEDETNDDHNYSKGLWKRCKCAALSDVGMNQCQSPPCPYRWLHIHCDPLPPGVDADNFICSHCRSLSDPVVAPAASHPLSAAPLLCRWPGCNQPIVETVLNARYSCPGAFSGDCDNRDIHSSHIAGIPPGPGSLCPKCRGFSY